MTKSDFVFGEEKGGSGSGWASLQNGWEMIHLEKEDECSKVAAFSVFNCLVPHPNSTGLDDNSKVWRQRKRKTKIIVKTNI